MSDGKEVKRWAAQDIMFMCGELGGFVPTAKFIQESEYDRIVAELNARLDKVNDVYKMWVRELETIAELRAEVERLTALSHNTTTELRDLSFLKIKDLEQTIARQAKVIEKLKDKLEEIRWSWANDAGRQCDNLAFEALAAIEGAEGEKE